MVDNTPEAEKKERLLTFHQYINDGYRKGHERFVDKVVKVLVDGESKNGEGMMCGYSEHNKLTHFKSSDASLVGKIVNVKVTEAKTWFMIGEICE
jgi:tRNA-2-methylthio-N6-dimethylallyladenosine synthase